MVAVDQRPFQRVGVPVEVRQPFQQHGVGEAGLPAPADGEVERAPAAGLHPAQQTA